MAEDRGTGHSTLVFRKNEKTRFSHFLSELLCSGDSVPGGVGVVGEGSGGGVGQGGEMSEPTCNRSLLPLRPPFSLHFSLLLSFHSLHLGHQLVDGWRLTVCCHLAKEFSLRVEFLDLPVRGRMDVKYIMGKGEIGNKGMCLDMDGKRGRGCQWLGQDLLAVYFRPEVPRAGRYALDLLP